MALLKGRQSPYLVSALRNDVSHHAWPNDDPTGKQFKFGAAATNNPWMQIVGVVGDVSKMALDQPPRQEMYLPYKRANGNYMVPQDSATITIAVRFIFPASILRPRSNKTPHPERCRGDHQDDPTDRSCDESHQTLHCGGVGKGCVLV